MFDDEINSPCEGEQSVYEKFVQRLKESFGVGDDGKSFRDRLGENLDDMLDDYLDEK